MLFFPEVRLKKICDSLIEFLIKDLKDNISNNIENESYLYLCFHLNENDNNFSSYYDDAKKLFLRGNDDPNKLVISPVFNRERMPMPTVHIVIPQDSENLRQIGDFEGSQYIDDSNKLERGYLCQFNLITTSGNISETLIINYVLRSLLVSSVSYLAAFGFIEPKFSVQDLNADNNLFPANVYVKGLIMSTVYTEIYPEITNDNKFNKLIFNVNKIIY